MMGPALLVEWILLAVCLTPPPTITLLNSPRDHEYCSVESSWCTERRSQPYKCNRSNSASEILDTEYATITRQNLTSVKINVDSKRVVNISLPLFDQPRKPIRLRPNELNIRLRPPHNFYFSEVHVGEMTIPRGLGLAGFRLHTSNSSTDVFNGMYATVNTTHFPSRDFNITKNSELVMIFEGDIIGSVEISILFGTAFEPSSQLQVFCDTNYKGYIQTLDWNGVSDYMTNTKSCVTIEIPNDHVIMISLVALEISVTLDTLKLYHQADCQGVGEVISELRDFKPVVYDRTRAVSLLFISNFENAFSGFRFLFSFHPNSQRPTKLPDGKWKCSVPFFSDFEQHFMCSAEVFCLGEQDTVVGCKTEELCGTRNVNQLELNGYCYRFFNPSTPYTWYRAAQKCESLRGHLMNLNSKTKRNFFEIMISNSSVAKQNIIYVGFKLSAVSGMYKNTRMWTDSTLVVFLRMGSDSDARSLATCGYVKKESGYNAYGMPCIRSSLASFVCEDVGGRDENYVSSDVTPPAPLSLGTAAANPDRVVTCDRNQTAHNFLACDIDTDCFAVDVTSAHACARVIQPTAPFFMCKSNSQPLPYSLVCDHRPDCCDMSDENFCVFPECRKNEFACLENRQCISSEKRCDLRSDCVDDSDESACDVMLEDIQKNAVLPPAKVDFTGRGDFVVTELNSTRCPDTHFLCPGNEAYCMPVYVRCNDVFDCPGKEDEAGCDAYTCPGFYRCRRSRICLHHDHLCDDVAQCPQRDDELMCNMTCPVECTCYGFAFICTRMFASSDYPNLRYLEASGTGMTLNSVSKHRFLIHLGLRDCAIVTIGTLSLPNLQSLDLSDNMIEVLTGTEFLTLTNLRDLSLANNPLVSLNGVLSSPHPLPLLSVNFAGVHMPQWHDNFSVVFPNVQTLNLSHCGLDKLSETGFQSLKQLRSLDLSECSVSTFYPRVFDGLRELRKVVTENYKLCCPSVLPSEIDFDCRAPTNEISSCDALLRAETFRVFLTLYALLSLLGNLGSFIYRSFLDKKTVPKGFDVFVTHLCVADFLMGLYLAVIGVADRMYYGNYVWKDVIWRNSTACKVAGFLSLVSSEVSAFIICLITLERFLVLRFPFKKPCFNRQLAHVACLSLWVVGLTLATIPLLPFAEQWEFYGQSSICIPLPITRQDFPGMHYAFGVLVGLNFVLFVLIAIGQLLIYWSIRSNTMPAKYTSKRSDDNAIARRLLAVVMTDFLCWFPIGLLGLLAKADVPIPGEVNVVMAVFVLPFNSALNPFLYTFNLLMERRRKARSRRSTKTDGLSSNPISSGKTTVVELAEGEGDMCTKEEAWKTFVAWLEGGVLSLDRVRDRVVDMDQVRI